MGVHFQKAGLRRPNQFLATFVWKQKNIRPQLYAIHFLAKLKMLSYLPINNCWVWMTPVEKREKMKKMTKTPAVGPAPLLHLARTMQNGG